MQNRFGKEEEFCQILFDGRDGFLRCFLSMILRNAIKEILGKLKDTCEESFILFNKERTNLESTLRGVPVQKEIHHCKNGSDDERLSTSSTLH